MINPADLEGITEEELKELLGEDAYEELSDNGGDDDGSNTKAQ